MRENIIQVIKKHDNIFVILLIFLSIFGITLDVYITSSEGFSPDELWNFQNTYKMYNGYQIYQDANVIVTPLFFWIGVFLFKILGANYLTYRIYNIIIMTAFYFLTYLILKKLNINRKIAVIITFLLIIVGKYKILLAQANYNTMAMTFCLLGIYFYINKHKYSSIIQGILLFIIFCVKQNIGVYYAMGLFVCEIMDRDKNAKEKIKKIAIELFTFLCFLSILLLYFYHKGNLYNFISYTVLGIGEFAKDNVLLNISNMILTAFFVSINLVLTIIFIKNKKMDKKQEKQVIVLNSFSIPLILIMVPICNDVHFLIGIYLSVLLFLYLIKILWKETNLKINLKIINAIFILIPIFTSVVSISHFSDWMQVIHEESYEFTKEKPFYGGIYKEGLTEKMDNITNYIENNSNRVVILSGKAALYMVPLKRSNGMMDLPLKGNLGEEGEKGLIEQIKRMENVEILIEKEEENINWQESKTVRQYIIESMTKIGEIEEFEIYR